MLYIYIHICIYKRITSQGFTGFVSFGPAAHRAELPGELGAMLG